MENPTFLSLRTFRRSGKAVDTPVWAARAGNSFYIFSAGEAGKVKRLRNSSRVQVARCDARGGSVGIWLDGQAVLLTDQTEVTTALAALRNKYGWQMKIADWGAKLTGKFDRRAYIRVDLAE